MNKRDLVYDKSKCIMSPLLVNIAAIHLIVEPLNNFPQLCRNLAEVKSIPDLNCTHPILFPKCFKENCQPYFAIRKLQVLKEKEW